MAENHASPADISSSGPLLLGYLFNYCLLGILSVQMYLYYAAFPQDQKKFKALVYFLYLIELTQTILMTHDAFERFIYGSGTAEAMIRINLTWFSIPLVDGLVAFLVQLQFAYRINLLRKSRLILALILVASLAQFGGALTTAIMASSVNELTHLSNSFVAVCFWLGGSAVADVTIALSMIYTLSRYDRSFQQTNDIVNKIIRLTVETGSITAIVAMIQLVLFIATPNKTYFIVPGAVLAKVYTNSLMAVFNSRIRINGSDDGRDSDIAMSVQRVREVPFDHLTLYRQPTEVRTQMETNIWRDPTPKLNRDKTPRSRVSMELDVVDDNFKTCNSLEAT